MECELSRDELVQLARDKVKLGEKLISIVNNNYNQIPGATRIIRKIQKEIKFYKKIIDTNTIQFQHITSSNLSHFELLVETLAMQRDVVHIDCVFFMNFPENHLLRVDIVAENGLKWIKVIAKNAKSMKDDVEDCQKPGSLLYQADDYIEASGQNFCMFQQPKVVFYFRHAVEDSLRTMLMRMGVQAVTLDEPQGQLVSPSLPETLNLDVTTMLAYISAVTNGSPNWAFKEPLLTGQAEDERKAPVKPILDKLFEGKRLICCELAHNSFQKIVSLLAGPQERARAALLMKRVEVLPDSTEIDEQLSAIQLTAKINERSLQIFGFGMKMLAVTVTSNKGFVRAVKMQGIAVPAFIHASRALTENKEATGTPLSV